MPSEGFERLMSVNADCANYAKEACFLLPHPTSLYRQIIQCHLQLCDGRSDFWMPSELLLQLLQNLVRTCNMGRCLGCVPFGLVFILCRHRDSPCGYQFYTWA